MLKYLDGRRDIGIHSDVVCDSLVYLIEKGVVTGRRKAIRNGQIVASYCMGTQRLYSLIDDNPLFAFHPIDYVCDPAVIGKNHKMVEEEKAFILKYDIAIDVRPASSRIEVSDGSRASAIRSRKRRSSF
jgi:acyl-CoA hydrolase